MSHGKRNFQGTMFEAIEAAADGNHAVQERIGEIITKPPSATRTKPKSTPAATAPPSGRPPTWWRYNELMHESPGFLRDHAHSLVEINLRGQPSVEIREALMVCRAPGYRSDISQKLWIEFILRVEGYEDWNAWESSFVIVPKKKEYTIVVDGEVLYVVDPPPPPAPISEAKKKRWGRA